MPNPEPHSAIRQATSYHAGCAGMKAIRTSATIEITMPIPPSTPAGIRFDSQPAKGATITLVSGQGAIMMPISGAEKPNWSCRRKGIEMITVIDPTKDR